VHRVGAPLSASRSPLSLDVPLRDGGDPSGLAPLRHEWLTVRTPTDGEAVRLDWLSDEVLEGVLFEARQAAGYSNATCSGAA